MPPIVTYATLDWTDGTSGAVIVMRAPVRRRQGRIVAVLTALGEAIARKNFDRSRPIPRDLTDTYERLARDYATPDAPAFSWEDDQ